MNPHVCPVCTGKQTVSSNFYQQANPNTAEIKCRSCSGTGVVWESPFITVSIPSNSRMDEPAPPPGVTTVSCFHQYENAGDIQFCRKCNKLWKSGYPPPGTEWRVNDLG